MLRCHTAATILKHVKAKGESGESGGKGREGTTLPWDWDLWGATGKVLESGDGF